MGILAQVADIIDPDAENERPELRTPVTLAVHCDRRYQVRAHLELIGEELAALERGDFDRLMINTPPRVGKTVTAVEWFVFWWLCHHPTHRVIIGCYGDDLAQRAGSHIRKLIKLYGAAYGLVLEAGAARIKDWSLTTGGGVRSVGVGSGITGHDGDLIIVDDPTKSRAEAESVARRDHIYDWWSGDLSTRTVPDTRILIIQTPWHPDDLRARVLLQEGDRAKGGRWRVVVMAAICDDPATDPLERAYGDPLPHPKIADGDTRRALRFWEQIRGSIAVRDWMALYQCDPKTPEGQLVSSDLLRERRCFQTDSCAPAQRVGVAVDPSGGGRDMAGIIGGYLGEDKRVVFTHDRSLTGPSAEWGKAACQLAAEIGADFFVFEANYGGDQAAFVIRSSWDALRREQPEQYGAMVPRIVSVVARKNKQLRAEPVGQQFVEDRVRLGAYLPELESEWTTWVPSAPTSPGRLDASVHLAYELLPTPGSGDASLIGATMLSEVNLLPWGR